VGAGDETLGKAIRAAVTEKIPNVLVVGEREAQEETVTLRRYGEREQQAMSADDFRARIAGAIRTRAPSV
jgi:threonyl-tRNA synthetase